MTAVAGYVERLVAIERPALEAAVGLAAASQLPNVLYEARGRVSWAEGTRVEVERAGDGAPLERTREVLAGLGGCCWRAYGCASFDLAHVLHGTGGVRDGTPLVRLLIPDREVRIDGGTALLRARDDDELDALEAALRDARSPAAGPHGALAGHAPELRVDGAYKTAVAAAVAEIRAGRLEKVILSRVVPVDGDVDLAATYLRGRGGNDPARSYLLALDDVHAAGFSPEIAVTVSADGVVATQPLAGTRARDGDPARDRARRDELCRDAKEVFEHAISVRLAADELASVCTGDSVRVERFMDVEERGSVQHLASRLSGRLDGVRCAWDAFAALFPAVTASGIPKPAACELIARWESEPRGLYSGAVMTVDADGTIDAALVLRSVFRQDGRTWLRAGAGIVADSWPERELEETCEKLRSVAPFLVLRPGATAAAPATPRRARFRRDPRGGELRRDGDVEVLGVGFGPANVALAIALRERGATSMRFLDRQPHFGWHRGMLLDDATMQVSFLKDLVTMRNPNSDFSFVTFLHERGRLVDFINHKTLFPLRIEFHEYLSWAAARLAEHVSYGHEVVDVRPRHDADGGVEGFDVVARDGCGELGVTQARDVVVAAGLVPVLPAGVRRADRIWHSAELLFGSQRLRDRRDSPGRLVVVGAGQSAAEAVAFLHREFPSAEICSVFSRFGYSPADDSPFANRIFDPDAATLFHAAPRGVKDALLSYHRNTNYSVVDLELIEQLYHEHYRERVLGRERLRMLNASVVRSCEPSGDGVEVVVESLATGERDVLRADAAVFATGYRPVDPLALLGSAGELCARDADGLAVVGRDHSLALTVPARAGIYVQGATEHAFGLTSTLLSMAAVRAGEIAAALSRSREPQLAAT